jgi:hypothetical protein
MLLRRLETSLFQDTIERADWHVHPEFSGHRDRTGLNRMLKLAVDYPSSERGTTRPAR